MRIHVNEQLCSGHGRCYSMAPSVYEADDEGYPLQRGHDVDVAPAEEQNALLGVANCPEGAIIVLSD